MKKKFAKDKEIKQANLRQRMRDLKKVGLVLRCLESSVAVAAVKATFLKCGSF
jgi:hypothetical protein